MAAQRDFIDLFSLRNILASQLYFLTHNVIVCSKLKHTSQVGSIFNARGLKGNLFNLTKLVRQKLLLVITRARILLRLLQAKSNKYRTKVKRDYFL